VEPVSAVRDQMRRISHRFRIEMASLSDPSMPMYGQIRRPREFAFDPSDFFFDESEVVA